MFFLECYKTFNFLGFKTFESFKNKLILFYGYFVYEHLKNAGNFWIKGIFSLNVNYETFSFN